jgi:hypothetical protein
LKAHSAQDPLHLIVGITGHRDICLGKEEAHAENLREAIYTAFTRLRGSSGVPVTVLSALAKGADRLAADIALKMGFDLVAVLPMPKEDYERDFRRLGETDDDITEFRTLLGLASNSFVVRSEHPERETVYGGASRHIAGCSHVLLALWDGGKETPGGTGWLVNRFLGRPRLDVLPAKWPHGPVYQIRVHRESACSGGESGFSLEWLHPEEDQKINKPVDEFVKVVCEKIRNFNADARKSCPDVGVPHLQDYYRIADTLAIKYRRWVELAFFVIYCLAAIAAFFFAMFAHSEKRPPLFLGLYGAFFGVAFGCYLLARVLDVKNKAEDYRALAEGLRVACGWRLLGIPELVSQHYLLRVSDEGRWTRTALAAFELIAVPERESLYQPGSVQAVRATIKNWIHPERVYYTDAWNSAHRKSHWVEIGALVFIGVSVVLALLSGRVEKSKFDEVVIASTVAAVIAALLHNFIEKRAWREHTRRYGAMSKLLAETVDWFEMAFTENPAELPIPLEETIRFLRGVGQQELDENGEWLQTHRDKPLGVPHVG